MRKPLDELAKVKPIIKFINEATHSVHAPHIILSPATQSTCGQIVLLKCSHNSVTIVGTVPEQQLEVGTLICGRPLPVGQTHRSYGGFLPVDESMSDGVLEACGSRNLVTVAISLSQIFDAAEMADAVAAE